MESGISNSLGFSNIISIGTALFIVIFWIALTPVEADVVDGINWYIFTNLQLIQMRDYHVIFKYFSYISFPLTILIVYCKSQIQRSAHLRRFATLTKVVEFLLLAINFSLLMFLFFKAQKMLYLLKLYLLYLATTLATSNIIVTPQIFLSFGLLLLLYHSVNKHLAVWGGCGQMTNENSCLKNCIRVIMFYWLLILFRSCVVMTLHNIGIDCSVLPVKPLLTAHRGCKNNFPENSITAFEGTSSNINSAATLETDVHISYDGVPFLLHDDTLARTTNIRTECPNLSPLIPASLLNYSSPGSFCNLNQLKITEQPISPLEITKTNIKKTIPTLSDFLAIAVAHNKKVIFDIKEPQNPNHPYYKGFIKLITKAIRTSNIREEKVWWLYKEGRHQLREIFPSMVQATKTKETPFEEFGQDNISLINDEWTIPEDLIKKYHNIGLQLNIWVINSRPLFEIFWCHGVESITTNACDYLSKINTNIYHEAYRELYNISDSIGVYISTVLFVLLMFYQKDYEQGSFLRLSNGYGVPLIIVTIIHIAFVYISAS